jgi:hypothetical protein
LWFLGGQAKVDSVAATTLTTPDQTPDTGLEAQKLIDENLEEVQGAS